MTILTTTPVTDRPARAARPVDLAWNALRQHRLAVIALLVLFAFLAARLVISGVTLRAQYAVYLRDHCLTELRPICGSLLGRSTNWITRYWGIVIFPGVAGVFLGAPLVAKEFETGTYRFSRVQGVSARRQLAVKLLILGGIIALCSCVLGLLAMWALSPLHRIALAPGTGLVYWWPTYFNITAVTLPAWALFDFCLGVAAGAAIRRVVPAIAVTLAVITLCVVASGYAALSVTDTLTFRLLSFAPASMRANPVVGQSGNLLRVSHGVPIWKGRVRETPDYPDGWPGPHGSWKVSGWFEGPHGQRMSAAAARLMLNRIPVQVAQAPKRLDSWLTARHISFWIGYQSAGRYWLFQAFEAGFLAVLAIACTVTAVWLAGRRT